MKDVKDFAAYVATHLFDANPEMAENHSVEVKEITKNNGVKLTGISDEFAGAVSSLKHSAVEIRYVDEHEVDTYQ